MTRTRIVFIACTLGVALFACTSAHAYFPVAHWTRDGVAGHTYHFSTYLHAGQRYSASLTAPHRYWNGYCYAPDMDLRIKSVDGRVYRFTRYGNERVDFIARYTGTYHFYAKPLYGNGTFHLSIGGHGLLLSGSLPAH